MSRIEVKMPQMGVSVTEGIVSAWHRRAGDEVREGDPLCDIATDKVDTEVPAPADGVVAELVAEEGDTVEVGAVLAVLTGAGDAGTTPAGDGPGTGESAAAESPSPEAPTDGVPQGGTAPAVLASVGAHEPDASSESAPMARRNGHGAAATVGAAPFDHAAALNAVAGRAGRHGHPPASPVARRVAVDLGVDLATVEGTGARGRIRKADVLTASARGQAAPQRAAAADAATVGTAPPAGPGHGPEDTALPSGYEDVPHEIVPTSRIRQVTADHMIRSRQTAAHMTTEVEVDMTAVAAVRAAMNAERVPTGQSKLSYLPFITRVACEALRVFPNLNATFERERYVRWTETNVGIAVDTPRGLLVPVVRGAQALTVEALADRIGALATAARDRTLDPDALRAGTFTISNPGSVGAVSAMAIINQPQVAILGLPAIVRRPWVVALPDGSETIAVRPILKLALTFDHRAIDGAEATRAAVHMKAALETWDARAYR
jgi:2-oxoglutarate dehydrogenase E2 component (dihydrolipoamide succinyltransferase)